MVLYEPFFLNLYWRCTSIGRGDLALFSARARERATAFWVGCLGRDEPTNGTKSHYKTQSNSKGSYERQGMPKAKGAIVQIEIGLPRTSDYLKIQLGRPKTGIVYVAQCGVWGLGSRLGVHLRPPVAFPSPPLSNCTILGWAVCGLI